MSRLVTALGIALAITFTGAAAAATAGSDLPGAEGHRAASVSARVACAATTNTLGWPPAVTGW